MSLLFRPVRTSRWIKLGGVCLFLGGGTPTAAILWAFSILPAEIGLAELSFQIRHYLFEHRSLAFVALALSLGCVLGVLYVRSILRFVLVDAVVRQEASVRRAWRDLRRFGRSYFFWLVGTLALLGAGLTAFVILTFPYLRSARSAGAHKLAASLLLMAILTLVVLIGLTVGLLITLTDDLVVPVAYAERSSLPAAWRKVGKQMQTDPTAFLLYIALRLVISVAVSIAILVFLFPLLVSLFSGVVIAAALLVITLRVMGFAWVWNSFTILMGMSLLTLLTALLFVLLSVVGMPGQVFIQDYGVRFISSRFPALEFLCRPPAPLNEHP